MTALLSEERITAKLATASEWARKNSEIVRKLSFSTYLDGIRFVEQVAGLAEAADHHPDIFIGWREVVLRLTTHSKGGLTEKDFALAAQIEAAWRSRNKSDNPPYSC